MKKIEENEKMKMTLGRIFGLSSGGIYRQGDKEERKEKNTDTPEYNVISEVI